MKSNKFSTGNYNVRHGNNHPVDWQTFNQTDLLQKSMEHQIKFYILKDYDKSSRPVYNDSTSVDVYVGMSLFHILDTDEKHQTVTSLISVRLRWVDEYLAWDENSFENVSKIWLPANRIWLPDVIISNYADSSFNEVINTNAIIRSDGTILWMYPSVAKTYCTLNVQYFPFDQQRCNISFFSWTYSGLQLNLLASDDRNINNYNPKNQEWFVDKITVYRRVQYYVCCPEPFPDVSFTIYLRRRSLFYVVNLIFPCLLIYTVSFLGFFLPVESGEKVNLEITILLALVVFLLIAGETLPPTPDAIPILGLLYGVTMLMVSLSLLMAVIVTNIYLRRTSAKHPPRWIMISADCIIDCVNFKRERFRRSRRASVFNITSTFIDSKKHADMGRRFKSRSPGSLSLDERYNCSHSQAHFAKQQECRLSKVAERLSQWESSNIPSDKVVHTKSSLNIDDVNQDFVNNPLLPKLKIPANGMLGKKQTSLSTEECDLMRSTMSEGGNLLLSEISGPDVKETTMQSDLNSSVISRRNSIISHQYPTHSCQNLDIKTETETKSKSIELQWEQLARLTDNLFFIIFSTLSFIILGYLFMMIPDKYVE